MTAVFSDCGTYRYALWRDTNRLGAEGTVLFVMLNPSTADAVEDDPTIRRCIGFAGDWGYARLAVANAYAYRATDPRELKRADDPIGPENDRWLLELAADTHQIIAAWGAHIAPGGAEMTPAPRQARRASAKFRPTELLHSHRVARAGR